MRQIVTETWPTTIDVIVITVFVSLVLLLPIAGYLYWPATCVRIEIAHAHDRAGRAFVCGPSGLGSAVHAAVDRRPGIAAPLH